MAKLYLLQPQSKQGNRRLGRSFQKFLDFIDKKFEDIVSENESSTDQVFKRKCAQYTRSFTAEMQKRAYSPKTINVATNIVKIFSKYSDLPLCLIPSGSHLIVFHNRDIIKKEIIEVLKLANVRDRVFFFLMSQSGVRTKTIANLKIEGVEGILDAGTPVPTLVKVQQENTKDTSKILQFHTTEAIASLTDEAQELSLSQKSLNHAQDGSVRMRFGEVPNIYLRFFQ